VTTTPQVSPPPERFNFAQHLLEANAARAAKTAVIDDTGSLTYGALAARVRLLASALCSLGLRREERLLLLMQDCADWPVSFLGAVYAGIVPVAVNTLLTPDDYAYMLEHSRAQAVLVSGALLPVLTAALIKSDHEVKQVVVVRPVAPLHPGQVEFESFLALHAPLSRPAATHADDPGFWLYSSGSTGRPKATLHSHANPYWTVLRVWPRQFAVISIRRRGDGAADGGEADARGDFQALDGRRRRHQAYGLLRCSNGLCRHSRVTALAGARSSRTETCLVGGRGTSRRHR